MKKILEILGEIRPEFDFATSEDYIEDGFLDSFDIVSLVAGLESEFGISIDGLDIVPENFKNREQIKALIIKSGGTL